VTSSINYKSVFEEFIATKLSNIVWRLDNLYTIIDKEDKEIIMRLNLAQRQLLSINHPKTITLKSRQRGISTFKVAEGLDRCITRPNTQAGIQSYGQSEAKKLYKKARKMWESYDTDILEILGVDLVSANGEGLFFSNGSQLKIGNFRGDTLSYLHVSELAKIAKKFPEKAEELNTGAFEAVSTRSIISIESTAEGNTGLFHDMFRTAEQRMKQVNGDISKLSPLDFVPVFMSWIDDDDCSMDIEYPATSDDEKYFEKVESDKNIVLTPQQKWWASAKRARLKNNFDREYPYNADSAFNIKVEGTYYSNEYELIKIDGNNYDSNLVVHSSFDLGYNDTFSIIFFHYIDGEVIIIGEYNNRGHKLEHYRDVFVMLGTKFGWVFGNTYVPHDISVTELIAGKTRWDALIELGFDPILVKRHKLQDGIEETRQFLSSTLVSINNDCVKLLLAVQNYRQKYDEKYKVFLDAPIHDEHSHPADALRYLAMGIKHTPPVRSYVKSKVTTRYSTPTGFAI
jgi:hypothetical protein